MDKIEFQHPDNWCGGPTYSLTLSWEAHDEQRLLRTIHALWQAPGLWGPWSQREDFPDRVASSIVLEPESGYDAYGLLRVADGTELGCKVFAFVGEGAGADWLRLYVYRAMQDRAFGVVYGSHFRQDNPWFDLLEAQYISIAEAVYTSVPFDLAVIDSEGPFPWDAEIQVNIEAQLPYGGLLLPPTSMAWVRDREGWIERPPGLFWLPPRAGWN